MIVFLQRRTNRAGAQVALSRLLTAPKLKALDPLVIVQDDGWLTEQLRTQGVKVVVLTYPSTRSLTGTLWRNRAFVRNAAASIGKPVAVIANNHQEAWLASEIGKATGSRSAVIIRDSYVTKEALEKYDWSTPDHALAVGCDLFNLASGSNDSVPVSPIYDALLPEDFAEPKPKADRFPDRVLVIGSNHPMKGWSELQNAVHLACEIEPDLKRVRFDFTGNGSNVNGFNFVGHKAGFKNRVREYDLVINPSKSESFGLAALETLAAGVPLLSTKVGVVGSLVPLPSELILPSEPDAMAKSLVAIFRSWSSIDPNVKKSQECIRQFTPESSAASVIDVVERMSLGE
ncbi:MAG: glycosyltransferase [Xanthobacteraceae bacterium]